MNNRAKRFCLAFAAWIALAHLSIWSCAAAVLPPTPAQTVDGVRSIELPHFEPDLPVVPGRNEYLTVCVSCHSPRYVTMQPPFVQRQWEETVDKMAKNYGALMDSEQRKAIIGYLLSIHGPDMSLEEAVARDDESDLPAPANLPAPPEPPTKLSFAADPVAHRAEVSRGSELFIQRCAGCHGITGRGDGVVSQVLLRKPKNLAANRFSLKLLGQVLWNGKRGTSMPSWRSLPEPDLIALAAYVQTLHAPEPLDPPTAAALEQGGKVFVQNCAPCHGETGDGKGPAAVNLLPEPANFKLKQPDPDYLLQVLSDGIPGTAMPSWKEQISDSDRRALSDFVRSLFEAAENKTPLP